MADRPAPLTVRVSDADRAIGTYVLSLPVGALDDPPDQQGLAYLTGQMLLRGAGEWNHATLTDELDFLGAGCSVGTGRARTTISGDALTRNYQAYRALVNAIVCRPRFDAAELDRLKRLVKSDLEQVVDNDAALGQRFFVRSLFHAHPYGSAVKGSLASLDRISIEDVRSFYRRFYTRTGLVAGAAGDVDAKRLNDYIQSTAGALPDHPLRPRDIGPKTTAEGLDLTVVDKPERSQTQVFLGHTTNVTGADDYYPLIVAHTIFGGTFTARLSHEIREKRGWSYGAYSYLATDQHLGTFTMRFYPASKDTFPALELCHALFSTFVADGPTEAEVEAAKNYLINSHPFSLDTPERRLSELLSAHLLGREPDFIDRFVDRIRAVTLEQVKDTVARVLTPQRLVGTVVGTASALADSLSRWSEVSRFNVVDYRTPL